MFKKIASLLTIALLAGSTLMPLSLAYAATPTNLIANPSVATPSSTSASLPANWSKGNWGTNTTLFSYLTTSGYSGNDSLGVNMTSYTSGDAKWYFTPVSVSANTEYTYTDYYEATVPTEVVVQFSDASGNLTYDDLGSAPASAANTWTPYGGNFTTSSTTTSVTVFHLLESVGSLTTSDFSLSTYSAPTTPVTPTPPVTSNGNLINNANMLTTSGTPASPTGWNQGGWGTNTPVYSYSTSGYNSTNASVEVNMTKYTSGDAKWYFAPVAVTASDNYTYSDEYKSNVTTDVVVQFDNGKGTYSYLDLGNAAAATSWAKYSANFTVPTGMTELTVFHLIQSVGTLTTSDFNLTSAAIPTVTVTNPAANQTVSGTLSLSSTTTGTGISSYGFEVDGTLIGSMSSTNGLVSWNSSTVSNGSHAITAVITTSGGTTIASKPVSITVSNTTTTSTNMIPNPTQTVVSTTSSSTPADWTTDSWGTNTPTFTYLKTGYNGARSVEVTMKNYTSGDAKWTFPNETITPGAQYQFSDYYESNVNTEVDAVFNMSDGTTEYQIIGFPSAAGTWTKFSTGFVVPQGTQTMTIYHLIQTNGYLTTSDYNMSNYTPAGFKRALVTLTFDDGYSSTYQYATPLLDADGYKSTQFIITDLLGETGYMTDANIQAMSADGQEIASHTVTHDDMTTETASQLTTELGQSQSTLESIIGKPITDIAYPYGDYDTTVLSQTAKYYSGARSVDDGLNSKDNFNAYNLKVQNIYNTTTTAQVADWVAQAQATNTWLILVYHSVDLTSNAFDGTSVYNVTPTQLSDQLAAIQASGITVATMQQALAEVEAQL